MPRATNVYVLKIKGNDPIICGTVKYEVVDAAKRFTDPFLKSNVELWRYGDGSDDPPVLMDLKSEIGKNV